MELILFDDDCLSYTWTQDSYNCWKSKCDCSNCNINTLYNLKDQCKMKVSVDMLVATIGEPTKEDEEKYDWNETR